MYLPARVCVQNSLLLSKTTRYYEALVRYLCLSWYRSLHLCR